MKNNLKNNTKKNEKLTANDIISNIQNIATYPFMNIFGVQRFGAPLPSNPEVGKRLLSSDYRGMM